MHLIPRDAETRGKKLCGSFFSVTHIYYIYSINSLGNTTALIFKHLWAKLDEVYYISSDYTTDVSRVL